MARRRTIRATAISLAIIGAAVLAVGLFIHQRVFKPYTDDASIDADVVHVAPSVAGRILRLAVRENQLVKAGDILFEIDPEPFKLRADLAAAELKAAEGLLDTQRRTVATETSNAAIAGDQVSQARSSLQLAGNTLDRLEPLLGRGYVSMQQVDDARTAKQKAETAYSQAVEQAAASKTAIGNLDSALANVEARRASLALAERDLRETDDLLLLLEENTRLRKLVVQLSNLLGDLPPFSSVTPIGGQMRPPTDHPIQKRVRNG